MLINFFYIILKKFEEGIFKHIFNEYKIYRITTKLKKIDYTIDKIVVYSALFGNYDALLPFSKEKNFDYFLFTNNKIKTSTNWTILPIPQEIEKMNISTFKKQRYLKLHPHIYFNNYKLSIYMDTSFIIIGNLTEFLLRLLSPKFNIYILEHQLRNNISSEMEAVKLLHFETEQMINLIKIKYNTKKFPDNIGLSENCLIIRYHNEREIINLMEEWWEEVAVLSHRDQLSFNYILWLTGIKIKYFSWNYVFEYFYKNIDHLVRITF